MPNGCRGAPESWPCGVQRGAGAARTGHLDTGVVSPSPERPFAATPRLGDTCLDRDVTWQPSGILLPARGIRPLDRELDVVWVALLQAAPGDLHVPPLLHPAPRPRP